MENSQRERERERAQNITIKDKKKVGQKSGT